MKTTISAAILLAITATAHAGGQAGSVGLGAEAELNDEVAGVSLSYDAGKFDADGLIGYAHFSPNGGNSTSAYAFGGHFFYHIHSTALSDFGLGGGLGIASIPAMMGSTTRSTDIYLEPGFQIRLFIASNVALSFTAGLSIALSDATTSQLIGQGTGLDGGAGIHYYFF